MTLSQTQPKKIKGPHPQKAVTGTVCITSGQLLQGNIAHTWKQCSDLTLWSHILLSGKILTGTSRNFVQWRTGPRALCKVIHSYWLFKSFSISGVLPRSTQIQYAVTVQPNKQKKAISCICLFHYIQTYRTCKIHDFLFISQHINTFHNPFQKQ